MGGGGCGDGGGVEAGGTVMQFPVAETGSYTWPPRIPRRLRRRLLVQCRRPCTVEEIEAKLRLADLRRQVSLIFFIIFAEFVLLNTFCLFAERIQRGLFIYLFFYYYVGLLCGI